MSASARAHQSCDVTPPPPAPISTHHKNYDPVSTRYDCRRPMAFSHTVLMDLCFTYKNFKTANIMMMALSYVNVGSVDLRERLFAAGVRCCPPEWCGVADSRAGAGGRGANCLGGGRAGRSGKQWHCENRRAYACFSRGDATRHLCAISQTDNIACARAPVTISHFEISARLQRTLFRCAAGRSIYEF